MKFKECYNCNRLVEDTDTEKIDGRFYCYRCFNVCQGCHKAYPLGENEESIFCSHCEQKENN